jgi:DNA polymerase-3 subunit alpha
MEVLFFAKSYSVFHEDLAPDSVVTVKGRVNWREDTMSVFGSGVIPVDISDAEHNPDVAPPFVLRAKSVDVSADFVAELKSTLLAHKGTTPVHFIMVGGKRDQHSTFVFDDFPVNASSELRGEVRGIRGVEIVA